MGRRARPRSPWWALALIVVVGALVGSVIAEIVVNMPYLDLMSREVRAGLDPPLTLDLRIVTLTIGFVVRLSLATVLGMIVAVWVFRLL